MKRQMAVLPTAMLLLVFAVPAFAQTAGQDRSTIGASKGSQTFSVKGHFSVFGAVGLDLDVIGDVSAGGVGKIRGTPSVVQPAAYPDVYVKTQRRRYVGASFGFSKKNEIMARYQEANNPAAVTLLGTFGTSTNTFPVEFDNYKDRLIEFGLRHYLATPKRSREYFSILYGMKTVDPIGIVMRAPGGAAPAALYSKSKIPSLGLEIGLSLEYGHLGIFAEGGFRWQKRLTRDDTDLAQYELNDLNNTGSRIFMPVTMGLHVRF